jgi:hypothetical protein
MEIHKGMYGLPQAGILANTLLKKCLAKRRYFEQPHTPGLWRHKSRQIWFNLAVDDFGIKYIGKGNPQHLKDALRKETTTLLKTVLASYIVASTLNGITTMDTLTFPCQHTS